MNLLKLLIAGNLLLAAFIASALDYSGIKKARTLENEKRYEEAIDVYEKLSDKTDDPRDDQRYMTEASEIAMKSMKNKDLALKLAGRIKNQERRDYVLMSIYSPEEIIAKYKAADFMTWSEDLRAEAYKNRGKAYESIKKYQEALSDFEKASSIPGSKVAMGAAAAAAGDIYLEKLKNEAKAEEMYKKALAVSDSSYSWRTAALFKLTDILLKNKKNKEALALYDNVDTKKIEIPSKKIAMAKYLSRVFAANGESIKALEQLNVALNAETKPENKKKIQEDIDKLSEKMLE